MSIVRNLRWQPAYLSVVVVVVMLGGIASIAATRLPLLYRARLEQEYVAMARNLAESRSLTALWIGDPTVLHTYLLETADMLSAHITAVTPEGSLLADSSRVGLPSDELGDLPEIRQAIDEGIGLSRRVEATSGEPFLYLAVPVREGGMTLGVLRLGVPRRSMEADVRSLRVQIWLAFGLGTLAVVIVLVVHDLLQWRNIRRLLAVAERLAAGDLDARILSLRGGEIGQLGTVFNRLADRLQRQVHKRARERDRLNTIMHVMTDGVIILNRNGEVRLLNLAAASMLDIAPERARGRTFVQAARNHRIAELWAQCLSSGTEEVEAIEFANARFLRVVVTPILRRSVRGYLVMLQDLTQVRRLQTIRQDFISNISHELRTPLASLRALVETLRDGAVDDPPAAARFLNRMEVEVDALAQMMNELLELSRIESGQATLRLRALRPIDVIGSPVQRLRAQAARANIELALAVNEDLPEILVDAGRIHQVVTNLVHNAIKFSEKFDVIHISAQQTEPGWLTIAIQDNGIGIEPDDQERIFERFFKVDRARTVGGTGLGLAIAKHIIQAHDGRIWVESAEGKGSTFYFTVPLADLIATRLNARNGAVTPRATVD